MNHLDPLNNSDGLIAWTIQEARRLSPAHRVPSEVEAEPSPNRLLEVLAAEALQMISQVVDPPSHELDTGNRQHPHPLKLLPSQIQTPFPHAGRTVDFPRYSGRRKVSSPKSYR